MHIHILGICGSFMGSLALLAREAGHQVSGADQQVYPPMSDQLRAADIILHEGYDAEHLVNMTPDIVVIGNALSRGNPSVEYVLEHNLVYQSGPQWLSEQVLKDRWVLAVAGTHGKTTTASMLAWILSEAGLAPGYLIGGVPCNFERSAQLGASPYFVIEADEYDTAFFDKRSKFVHYHPRTLVLNNLEFDHADIFSDLAAIQTQFHHLVRTVPAGGKILMPADTALEQVIEQGCWSPIEYLSSDKGVWQISGMSDDLSTFSVCYRPAESEPNEDQQGRVDWTLSGRHNQANALAAIAAANHVGVSVATASAALSDFTSVKRRMEEIACIDGVTVYDDFAHHPSAIQLTLAGLRAKVGGARIIAVIEPRSNTMRMGYHDQKLLAATDEANVLVWYSELENHADNLKVLFAGREQASVMDSVADIVDALLMQLRKGDHVVIMSNGAFSGIHSLLVNALVRKS